MVGTNDRSRSAFATLPVRTAYQQVADQLRNVILSGELTPGDKLPIESDLMALFGVSRSTIREALRVLSSQGLISTTRGVGGGSVVAHPDANDVGEYLEAKLGLLTGVKQVSVDDLLEARALLEVPGAGLAAERRTDEQLEVMRRGLGLEGRAAHRDEQMRFHVSVLEAAGNPLLRIMTSPVFGVLRVKFLRDAAPEQFWDETEHDHQHIFDAIEAKDRALAEERMAAHLARLRETYLTIYLDANKER